VLQIARRTGRQQVARPGRHRDGFHVYGLEWTSSSIVWSIDGAEVYRRNSATTPWFAECFQRPFNFRLNQEVGGSWPGSPTSTTPSPADFQIDDVRVYQK
jgi:beta-glucanase (GH16 family)